MAQPCSPGLDCALLNSCPSYYVPCPEGYFCGSYQAFPDESGMDYEYATMKEAHNDVEVTRSNAYLYIDPDRAIQNRCLNGYYCESDMEMATCPGGHWCSESTVEPRSCGLLSICPESSYYEVNFTNLFLGLLAAICLLVISTRTVIQQRRKDALCRNTQLLHHPSHFGKEGVSDNKMTESSTFLDNHDSVAIDLIDISYAPNGRLVPIIHDITTSFPAGKMTMILGPSGCGKTSLLNIIRNGGKNLNAGHVQFRLQSNSISSINISGVEPEFGNDGEEGNVSDIISPLLSSHTSQHQLHSNNENIGGRSKLINRSDISQSIGLVPQDDVLDRKLTVREQLLFHALIRSKPPLSIEQAHRIVHKTLADLSILHIADAVIGGGENAAPNISGGQLKRVNIACELVAISVPGVLLLDEPTSGLDAAVAYELMECIDSLKQTVGITIISVLQQPRHEIFIKMDHLLLMHPRGSIVYAGPPQHVSTHLQNILHYQPYSEETSDADFCIDVLNMMKSEASNSEPSCAVSKPYKHETTSQKSTIKSTENAGALYQMVKNEDDENEDGTNNKFDEETYLDEEETRLEKLQKYQSSFSVSYYQQKWWLYSRKLWSVCTHERFYRQIYLEMERLILVRLRDRLQLLIAMAINVLMAVSLSSGFSVFFYDSYSSVFIPPVRDSVRGFYPSPLSRYSRFNTNDYPLQQLLLFSGAALGCASCLTAIPVFSGMRHVAQREHDGGVSLAAYAIGRMIGDIPFVLAMSLVFCGTWCSFGMPGYPGDWLLVIGATAYAASGIGYLASTFSSTKSASVNGILITFLCAVFAGVEPKLHQVEKYSIVSYPWYFSFGTWTSEATYVTWANYLHDYGQVDEPIQEGASVYGYDVSHGLTRSILALLGLGTAIRLVVMCLILYYK